MGKNLLDRLSKDFGEYLEDGYGCDVRIHVGEYKDRKTFEAHSMILAARSPYFRREIDDIPLNSRRSVIEFHKPKIPSGVFKPLLRYIYTGIVPLHNTETDDLLEILLSTDEPLLSDDPSLVVDFLLTAKELELSELVNYLQSVLIDDRTEWLCKNIDKIYARISDNSSLKILKDFYKNIIRTDVELMFQLENFSKLPLLDVVQMVSRDDLLVEEVEVWNQVVRWSVAQFPGLSKNPEHWTSEQCEDMKLIMENFVHLIRWAYITRDEFTTDVVPYTKILPDKLHQDLVKYFVNQNERSRSLDSPKRLGKVESDLISVNHASLISQWIRDQHDNTSWQWFKSKTTKTVQYRYNLLIRGSQHGFSKSDFQEACQYKGPTVTLIRPEGTDLIIGGYNPTPWVTSEKSNTRTRNSFIFTFDGDNSDPMKVGRFSKLENFKTCPIISITDEGLKFGKDLSLKFADTQNEINPTLDYHNVEYTLLDNVQMEIENPVPIKDYEVFSIHNISSSNKSSLSKRIFKRTILSFRNILIFTLNVFLKFMLLLLEYRVPGKIFEIFKIIIFDFFLKYHVLGIIFGVLKSSLKIITFGLLPGLYEYGKSFVETNGPGIKRWWDNNSYYVRDFVFVPLILSIGFYAIYLVLWYLAYFLFHLDGWIFWIWDWTINIALIVANSWLFVDTIKSVYRWH